VSSANSALLHEQHCRPLGPEHALDRAAAQALLAELEPGWRIAAPVAGGAVLEREFRCADFRRTIAFVNALAAVAIAQDHHPELEIRGSHCRVRYSTHSARGLTRNDYICAARIERLPR
jgi:4a-hydroxytetrahydrobiopterin dehydratase